MDVSGRRVLVTGVITRYSIAWEVARQLQEAGDDVVLTGFGRTRRMTERAARSLPDPPEVLELDVDADADLARLADDLGARWDHLDGVLHAIAHAPEDALGGRFLSTPRPSAIGAFQTSAFSYKALAVALLPLLERAPDGGAVVGLDFDATVAWPAYDWMGVAKAALESVNRYLARDLGPRGVRVNLVSAGPVRTAAAGGIPGFDTLADAWAAGAPLGWDPADPAPVAAATCFLLGPGARGVTGEILHVDGGFHAMGAPGAAGAAADGITGSGECAADGGTPPRLAA